MVRTGRETFAVTTVGAGQPDYAQPVTEVAERALIVKFPESEVAGRRYDDSTTINFTATQQEYIIGTNANAALPASWPSGVIAKEIAFYATQPCFIRFNDRRANPQPIPAGLVPVLRFFKRCDRFYVTGDVGPGVLYAWIEG